jgi:hypothetical protein
VTTAPTSAQQPKAQAPAALARLLGASLRVAATIGCAAAVGLAQAQAAAGAGSAPRSPDLAQQSQAALADAAQRTGMAATELKIASAEAVTWLDGSLGCPEADLMYTQALVPGYRIRIEAGGQSLDYHADARGQMVLCPPQRAVDPPPPRR